MISRKSAKLIALGYATQYCSTLYNRQWGTHSEVFNKEDLYDFLYDRDYEAIFLNLVKQIKKYDSKRLVQDFFMQIHTGESLLLVTVNWTWEARQKVGQRYLKDLAEDLINGPNSKAVKIIEELKAQLELDGFIFIDGTLYRTESSVVDEKEEQSYLVMLVEKLGLDNEKIILHHISLAEEHYINSKWDDSISNSRKFLEAVLQQIANAINVKKYGNLLKPEDTEKPAFVRDYLERVKLLEKKERESIGKFYGLLSDTGGHPYIAEKDQARLMRQLALTLCQFVLLRYDGFLKTLS
ncbi:MAG: hypothetical protein WA118_13700 [Carboxydocellales bacterium]